MSRTIQKAKPSKPRGPTRFPGITADAHALGVDRVHLFRVLTGTRKSADLMARYRSLKSKSKKAREVASAR